MDLDAAIGRVLMVAPPDDWRERSSDWFDDLRPAGIILFRRHIPDDFESACAAIARLHDWAAAQGRALLVGADEEGGFVTQTSHLFPVPPSARALAWGASPADVRQSYARYGAWLRALGLNVDFAPVCDVNDNPLNPVIGVRAFGTAPETVRDYASAAAAGLRDAGLVWCLKHFPGHGDTDRDSHLTLPVLAHSRERLERVELVPFRALVGTAPLVMVAHLACPELGEPGVPATLSAAVASDLLRRDLGFEGVAITDAMEMEGVAGVFGTGEAAVRALAAGCDLLLYCFGLDGVREARAGLRAALDCGRLQEARLEEAAARVARLAARVSPPRAPGSLGAGPAGNDDAHWYHALCRKALRVENEAGWRSFWRTQAAGAPLHLVGWNDDVLAAIAQRLRVRGVAAACARPEASMAAADAAILVILAERRPLAADAVACLRRIAGARGPVALANVLTPEVDAPVAEMFAVRLQSADRSAAMLDVIVDGWIDQRS